MNRHIHELCARMAEATPVQSLKANDFGIKKLTKRVPDDDEIRTIYGAFDNTAMRRKPKRPQSHTLSLYGDGTGFTRGLT
ncbi:hypothetical protein CRX72_18445 [Pantoea sp. BRM17]|nr:hypothetical protein CRX72_18445 [Pantoea sp. BRM17]